MYGIDISSWNGFPLNSVTAKAFKQADFVIVKATEGIGYKSPVFEQQIDKAKKAGKLIGAYHYASGGNPEAEALHFYNAIRPYIGTAIPVLDWESGSNSSWNNNYWCKRFAESFYSHSSVWPLIYIQASAISQAANCAKLCGLWIAGYPDSSVKTFKRIPMPYKFAPWEAWTIWQYTSTGGVDRNVANINAAGWYKIAQGDRPGKYKLRVRRGTRKEPTTIGNVPFAFIPKNSIVSIGETKRNKYGNVWGRINAGQHSGKWILLHGLSGNIYADHM